MRRPSSLFTLIEFTHEATRRAFATCLQKYTTPLLAVDATAGNGYDTLFLAQERKFHNAEQQCALISFDVQAIAIAATNEKLRQENALLGVTLVHEGHEYLEKYITDGKKIAVALFNLGYLPGSDKSLATQANTTVCALNAIVKASVTGSLISVHAYAGHAGGAEEREAIDAWFRSLSLKEWAVMQYAAHNKTKNPETLYLAERL